jgi:hypothetical protein
VSDITRDALARVICNFGYLCVTDLVPRDIGYVYPGLSLDYTSETTFRHPFTVVGESSIDEYRIQAAMSGAFFPGWPFYYRVTTD